MYLRRIRLANWLKSCSSFCRIWFSFVTGVGINFDPLESNLVWSGVNWKSVRFLMCLLLDFVFPLFLFRLLNLVAFLVLKFALPYKLSPLNVTCRHRKEAGIWFIDFILNIFYLWQFLHHRVNLGDLFLDIVCHLAYIFLYIAFVSGCKCFVHGLVENSLRSILSMSSGVFLTK